jgi:hypothetical protein
VTSESTAGADASSTLEQAIVELQRLHEILLAGDLKPRVLTDLSEHFESSQDCRMGCPAICYPQGN